MIYLRRECTPVRNGINIFREFDRSIGFILRIGKFGWYVRWSRRAHRLFHEIGFNAFPLEQRVLEIKQPSLSELFGNPELYRD